MYINNIKHLNHFVPPNFQSHPIITKKNKPIVRLNIDYLSDLFNAIYFRYLNYFNASGDGEILIQLSSRVLRKKYGDNYMYYVQYLVDKNFIVLRKKYLAREHCTIYAIRKFKFRQTGLTKYKNTNTKLITYYNRLLLNSKDESPIYTTTLIKSIKSNLKQVTIDKVKAVNFLNTMYQNKNNLKYQRNLNSINSIAEKHLYLISDSHGRIHTNLTVLKKEIKEQFISIGGKPIKEKDISNSQPLFFLYLLSKNLDNSINQRELLQFEKDITGGTIYDKIASITGKTRDATKDKFFKFLFGNPYVKFNEFTNLYPTISKFLRQYKISIGDYKIFSHELQLLEGNFIFNAICKKLTKQKIKYFTVHDSVNVKQSDFAILDVIFEKELDDLKKEISTNINTYFSLGGTK